MIHPPRTHLGSLRRRAQAVLVLALLGSGMKLANGQVITEFTIPTDACAPVQISAGPDGNLWFTEQNAGQIGKITPVGVFTEFPTPIVNSYPVGITAGPDGNLWFTDANATAPQIGRITPAGVVTEFPITPVGLPVSIAAGPDGNLWFTLQNTSMIGRITTNGVVTEFSVTAESIPGDIAAGPDGNLWFTETGQSRIGRITTAGVVIEFPVPGANPKGIAAGPDGNLWFTEETANKIGRMDTSGIVTGEFPVPTSGAFVEHIAAGPDGNLWFTEYNPSINNIGRITIDGAITEFSILSLPESGPFGITSGPDGALWFTQMDPVLAPNHVGRITTGPLSPVRVAVDAHSVTGSISNANGLLEPGETVQLAPTWQSTLAVSQTFIGTVSNLTGPNGPTYTIDDNSANYGTIAAGASGDCYGATGDCYLVTISGPRPTAHWDAAFTESTSIASAAKTWKLHVGNSFLDVPTTNQFYASVENLFHNGVTGGCGLSNYCPDRDVTRAEMAVVLMKSKLGSAEVAPPATGLVFSDVHIGDFAANQIEQLAGFQITGGCGGGDYCPNDPVTRAQMAVFLLKAEHGSGYAPPACAGTFADVECLPSPAFAVDWIEQLSNEGITGGCGGGMYCPNNSVTRGQMAAFLVKTFGLQLYGP